MAKKSFKSYWLPPEGAAAFFRAESDWYFRQKHPFLYPFVVLLGLAAFLLPFFLYGLMIGDLGGNGWTALGYLGGLIAGVGCFNLVAIIMKQYLGHLVTLCAWGIGLLLMLPGVLLG